jgi:oligoribonuclease NrnB/cAMP/cGMP phosphodiesterase (DHH superfamily)
MSGAIIKNWFLKKTHNKGLVIDLNKGAQTETNQNELHMIGYNYGDPIPTLDNYDQVIMCDISFPVDDMNKLFKMYKNRFVWIDHHESAIKENGEHIYGLRNVNFAACELTWKYFCPNTKMPELVRLLGRYDCMGSKGTDEEQKVLEFQYGARTFIKNVDDAHRYLIENDNNGQVTNSILTKGKYIYEYVCSEAKDIYNLKFDLMIDKYKFLCINKERFNPINFGIKYHDDGYDGAACFHYDGNTKLWSFSLYNDNGQVDCSILAKKFNGGGHPAASGFKTKDINQFVKTS